MNQDKNSTYITYNIETINGVVGDIGSIDNLSTGDNTTNISKKNTLEKSPEVKGTIWKKKVVNLYKNLTIKKIYIELNEDNAISDQNDFDEKIQKAIRYKLENKSFCIYLKPIRHLSSYKNEKALEAKNIFYEYLLSNNEHIKKCEMILNESMNAILHLYENSERKLIFRGIIEYYKRETYSNLNKVSFGYIDKDFYCSTQLNDQDMEELDKKINNEMNRPYSFVDFYTGFDIHDLPYNAKYIKAIPTILFEMKQRNIDLSDLEQYLNVKIGN
ncbi:hypothetical protein [Sulfuricurvum sp.]|uniref:hypothetical protein n=1 Tax=Sulfuricurvum sp. TaxID=2025608 RepID=UPI003C51DA10